MKRLFLCVFLLACIVCFASAACTDSDFMDCPVEHVCSSGDVVDDPADCPVLCASGDVVDDPADCPVLCSSGDIVDDSAKCPVWCGSSHSYIDPSADCPVQYTCPSGDVVDDLSKCPVLADDEENDEEDKQPLVWCAYHRSYIASSESCPVLCASGDLVDDPDQCPVWCASSEEYIDHYRPGLTPIWQN
jgi:hypothetical protein